MAPSFVTQLLIKVRLRIGASPLDFSIYADQCDTEATKQVAWYMLFLQNGNRWILHCAVHY